MKMVKPSAAHVERFKSLLPAEVVPRPMFGCTAGFVAGNMACGTWEEGVMVRLTAEDAAELLSIGGEPFMPMGKKMGNHFLLPANIVASDSELRVWIGRGIAATRRLPPKMPKEKKVAKAKK